MFSMIGNSLLGTVAAATGTVEKAAQTAEATVGTVKGVAKTTEQATKFTEKVGELATEAADKSKVLVTSAVNLSDTAIRSTDETLGSTNKALNTSIQSLNDQIGNLNKNTNTIMEITNDSLEKSKPHLSNTVGNTTEIASRLTSATTHSIEFGQNVVSSLFSILQYPFESIQQKIQDIKNNKEKSSIKINKIKNEIKNNFTNIKKETLTNFSKQIDNLVINIDTLIKLFESLSCKKNWMGYFQCDDSIKLKINAIESTKRSLQSSKNIKMNIIKNILNKFYTSIDSIHLNINDNISQEDFELKAIELENKSQEIQSITLSEAVSKFSEIMKDYELKIAKIEKFVENIVDKMNKKLEDEDNTNNGVTQSETEIGLEENENSNEVSMSGGRKNKTKKQRKNKTKKQTKNKSNKNKSKK